MSPSSLSPPARTRQFRGADLLPPFSVIFWAGDFNYRIELPNEDARELATSDNLHHLVVADQVRPLQTPYSSALEVDRCLLSLLQLTRAMMKNAVFGDYEEGEITFR